MHRLLFIPLLAALASPLTLSAQGLPQPIQHLSDSIKGVYAPDSRTAIYQIAIHADGTNALLSGTTTSRPASQALEQGLKDKGYQVLNSIRVLPDDNGLGEATWGIIRNSVCNLRSRPDYDASQSTQAMMGTPVRVIQRDGWYQVQTPDRYLGWVERAAVQIVTRDQLRKWNSSPLLVVTALWGQVMSADKAGADPVSDVVAGNRLRLLETLKHSYHVELPNGLRGYLDRSLAMPLKQWRKGLDHSAGSLLRTARRLIGTPYLWSGMTPKGMDCSGFVRTVLYMNDIIIPRDASQMYLKGDHIEIAPDYSNLRPGDLVFFGRKATATSRLHVSHVGLYMGGGRFIHSLGTVHISSFLPSDSLYDAYDTGRLLFASRFLPYLNQDPDITTTDHNDFYR